MIFSLSKIKQSLHTVLHAILLSVSLLWILVLASMYLTASLLSSALGAAWRLTEAFLSSTRRG